MSQNYARYEKSGTHRFEVPRMLRDNLQALEEYVRKNNDKEILNWWAQYLESTGEMNAALQFYKVPLYFTMYSVYCIQGTILYNVYCIAGVHYTVYKVPSCIMHTVFYVFKAFIRKCYAMTNCNI